ncbi:hypothetical protein [Halomarina litorea]|uniref:hypothetical protein n=1 Tax=Halomarina litorea TaxID=2961595 RepID=UPI0020C52DB8|nr:hypothetical protein [Halomarina sp. BCD28]
MSRFEEDTSLPRAEPPEPGAGTTMECRACGARFPRREVASPEKGTLTCPACDSTELTTLPD